MSLMFQAGLGGLLECMVDRTGEKYKTWALLKHLCEEVQVLVLIGGDFIEILSYEEKEGGVECERRAIPEFRSMMENCDLRDLGFEGQWYTWERGLTVETRVRERLDRFLGNVGWFSLFPESFVEHLVRFKSDHTPILLCLDSQRKKKRRKKGRTKDFILKPVGC